MDSCSTQMVTLSTKGSGGMIILRERENSITIQVVMIGLSMKESSGQAISKGLGSCFIRMETGIRDSLETTYCGARGECSVRTVRSSRLECGRKVSLYLNCDLYFSLIIQCSVYGFKKVYVRDSLQTIEVI